MNLRDKEGWLKHAFILSYFFLLRYHAYIQCKDEKSMQDIYYEAVYKSIQQGGDTDTNACIVGGMMGALNGIKGIPQHMIKTLVGFDCTQKTNRRRRP